MDGLAGWMSRVWRAEWEGLARGPQTVQGITCEVDDANAPCLIRFLIDHMDLEREVP